VNNNQHTRMLVNTRSNCTLAITTIIMIIIITLCARDTGNFEIIIHNIFTDKLQPTCAPVHIVEGKLECEHAVALGEVAGKKSARSSWDALVKAI
jgi:hypothetical protein